MTKRWECPRNKKFLYYKIDPCPFCGNSAKISQGGSYLCVECVSCFCRTGNIPLPEFWEGTWKEMWWEMRNAAVSLWNQRVKKSPLI